MVWWWALAAAAGALLAVTAGTARAPAAVPSHDEFLVRWRRLHGGYDPRSSRMVGGWLRLTYRLARPAAAAGLRPDALTAWGVWVSAAALAVAAGGGPWLVLAGLLVVVSALGDALDGAVAALTGRASRWGYVLDSLADRASELLYVAAVWLAGAPGSLAAGTAVGVVLLEYVRARAAGAGGGEIGTVTVGERPTRVIACATTLVAAGIAAAVAPGAAESLATIGLTLLAALTVAGLAQLLVAVRRRLGPQGQERA